ncbi:hypothetical protein EC912_101168 [Luteibacter rhizovicinus]|uniref:Uncharacterized protein n=1 Tax=Luteibacter rhizovicinus TaxID=242606 RepID=A0A4R3Z0F6_9GAMM|nr:hypothetical protein [Luteibacter rhizovicinus]TCV97173.1 hypothetical protein EC912_101168 [Luteibacter rhizovicinus]
MTRTFKPLIAALLLASPAAFSADVLMANGSVRFSTPDTWLSIMQTDGDPEVQVFQVPDPSTATNALARVTVTVKQVASVAAFKQYIDGFTIRAKGMTGYAATPSTAANEYIYTAQESGVKLNYRERYWFVGDRAIQLRCVRPTGAAAWNAAFDRGCDDIASHMST